MPRTFVANLQFEQQLVSDRQTLPVQLAQRAAELAACWLAACSEGDCIWCPESIPQAYWEHAVSLGLPRVRSASRISDVPEQADVEPWGWSPAMRRFATQLRASINAPGHDAVVRANSRRFGFELEHRWNCGLTRARPITTTAELEAALRTVGASERWVLKAEFGSAARERVICYGADPASTAARWIRKRLAAGNWLCFEPWVERIVEAGLQWTIPPSGPPILAGVTGLLTDADGQYGGSEFGLQAETRARWQPAIDIAQQAVAEIQRLGYFGPVGIDAMRYRDTDGQERLRPLQDINARWTMGRLALGWQQIMPRGVWRHGTPDEFATRQQTIPDVIRTSPESIGNRPASLATWLEPHARTAQLSVSQAQESRATASAGQ